MALPVGLKEVTRELLVYSEDLVFPGSQKFAQATDEIRAYIPVYLKEHPNEKLYGSRLAVSVSFTYSPDMRTTKFLLRFLVIPKDQEE